MKIIRNTVIEAHNKAGEEYLRRTICFQLQGQLTKNMFLELTARVTVMMIQSQCTVA